jgi:hypothetical protein
MMNQNSTLRGNSRPGPAARAGRRLGRWAAGLVGLALAASVAGCGNNADVFAVIVVPEDIDWGLLNPSVSYRPVFPVQIQVQKSSSDNDPVPGAEITVQVGGINLSGATMDVYRDGVMVATGVTTWNGQADQFGTITVDPQGTTSACGASTSDLDGTLTVGAWISRDARSWTATFSISCS